MVVNALLGLYYHKDESYYEMMVALAGHPEPRLRAALAWGLGHLGDEKLRALLEKLATDPSPEVRQRALASLSELARAADSRSE